MISSDQLELAESRKTIQFMYSQGCYENMNN